MSQELELIKPGQAVARVEPEMSPREMFNAVMEAIRSGKLTPEGVQAAVQAASEAVKLSEHQEDRKAKKAFIAARVRMQQEMRKVQATKPVLAKDGTVKYMVAPFEEIDDTARPIYDRNGFCVSFTEGPRQPGLVTKICVLEHVDGHSEQYPYTVRIGQGPHGATETQADSAAHSSAMRGALCGALNIIISHQNDDDDSQLGQKIDAKVAEDLRRRVLATGTLEESFLKFAEAKTFEEIYTGRYEELDQFLAKRERFQAAQKAKADADIQRRINQNQP